MVASNKTEGKDENSKGLRVPIAIMMISTLVAILNVNNTSSKNVGNGTTSIAMINSTSAGILRLASLILERSCRIVDSAVKFIAALVYV